MWNHFQVKWLPLHTLAASGEFYLVDALLKHNVDINATDKVCRIVYVNWKGYKFLEEYVSIPINGFFYISLNPLRSLNSILLWGAEGGVKQETLFKCCFSRMV